MFYLLGRYRSEPFVVAIMSGCMGDDQEAVTISRRDFVQDWAIYPALLATNNRIIINGPILQVAFKVE